MNRPRYWARRWKKRRKRKQRPHLLVKSRAYRLLSQLIGRRQRYGRTISRTAGRRGSVEIWRRLLFHHTDFHYCVLAAWLCALLIRQRNSLSATRARPRRHPRAIRAFLELA